MDVAEVDPRTSILNFPSSMLPICALFIYFDRTPASPHEIQISRPLLTHDLGTSWAR